MGAQKNERILDIGAGKGEYALSFSLVGADAVSIDSSLKSLHIAKKRSKHRLGLDLVLADAQNLPFKANVFDKALCCELLEHVQNDEKATGEIRFVLKRGGLCVFCVPNVDYPKVYDIINYVARKVGGKPLRIGLWSWGHYRLYSMGQILSLLRNSGFDVNRVRQVSHSLVAFYENGYVPYVIEYFIMPFLKRFGIATGGSDGSYSHFRYAFMSFFKRTYARFLDFMCSLDERVKNGNGVNIIVAAKKSGESSI